MKPKGPEDSSNDQVAELVGVGRELIARIDQLTDNQGNQLISLSKTARTNRRFITVIGVGFALDVLITVAMILYGVQLNGNSSRLDELTHRLDVSQTTTRQQVLCPLYQLFRDSRSPEGRKRAVDPEDYDRAFDVIEKGYDVLNCEVFIGGSPTPPSPQETQ